MIKKPYTKTEIRKLNLYFITFINSLDSNLYIAAESFEAVAKLKTGVKSIELISDSFEQADQIDIFIKNS